MEENLVYYQLFILLVVSGSLNVNHLYRGVTTLSIEDYLNTHHTLYPAGSRVSPTVPGGGGGVEGGGLHSKYHPSIPSPKTKSKLWGVFIHFNKVSVLYTEIDLQTNIAWSIHCCDV